MKAIKAVILAAGLGSRMRQSRKDATLTRQQAAVAATGIKALIPIGRPFLDYVLASVADAGVTHVCLVIGPNHEELRRYYSRLPIERFALEFAVQPEPLGTANALVAAADFAKQSNFLVLNSDNYYPAQTLKQLLALEGNGLAGFNRHDLVAKSNISADRVNSFSLVQSDAHGKLQEIFEKPTPERVAKIPTPHLVSMNCWRFNSTIFQACQKIERSPRGEYEIPDAVMYAIRNLGQSFQVLPTSEAVLDISSQEDIEEVAQRLANVEVRL